MPPRFYIVIAVFNFHLFPMIFMKKKLIQFDSEKDEWYYQPKIYINRKSGEPLYSETIEFKSSLSRDLSSKFVQELDLLLEDENEPEKGKPKKSKNNGIGKILNGNQKLRKPVISFFSDKAATISREIDKLNRYIETRKAIHKKSAESVTEDIESLSRFLKEIGLYAPGTKHSIDIRRLDLKREMLGLRKELRIAEISLFKDILFLRNTQREMIFEYQALKRMSELVENGGGNDVSE